MAAEPGYHRLPPPWLGNLMVFGLLFAMVLAWFYTQTRQAEQAFLDDAGEHASLLADAVALHARGAVLAQGITDTVLIGFLGNAARFVDYLDAVEPFNADELAAFAEEAGLSSIRVQRDGDMTQGIVKGNLPTVLDCAHLGRLIRPPETHSVLYGVSREDAPGCVLVGMDSRRIEALREAVGLPRALDAVAALPGIVSVDLRGEPGMDLPPTPAPPVVSIHRLADGRTVAQALSSLGAASLSLQMDAGPLLLQRERLWLQFAGFALALTLAGGIGTWLLYRHQRAHDRKLREYERRLSQQREDAGLGRAAAAIAHEVRNPLNAMAMGLQRLQFEASELTEEHRHLVSVVLQAVHRTDGTVSGLLDYARPYRPRRERVLLDSLLREQISLYRQTIQEAGLDLRLDFPGQVEVAADPDLLRQVLDNLLRNVLEARPRVSRLELRLSRQPGGVMLQVANDGLETPADELQGLLQPWFTTKTEGTGLGLAISRRIVASHGGELTLAMPRPGWLEVRIVLPPKANLSDTAE